MARKYFKAVDNNVLFTAAPTRDEILPKGSAARVIDNFVNGLDDELLEEGYRGNGAPAYSPKALLKCVLLAYAENLSSCREIAARIKWDGRMQYFIGYERPSHNTINRFRSKYLGDKRVLAIFERLVCQVVEMGLADVETVCVDGTTIEARASRHQLVWRSGARKQAWTNNAAIAKLVEQVGIEIAKDSDELQAESVESVTSSKENTSVEQEGPANAAAPAEPSEEPAKPAKLAKPAKPSVTLSGQGGSKKDRPATLDANVHHTRKELETLLELVNTPDALGGTPKQQAELKRRLERAVQLMNEDLICGNKNSATWTDLDCGGMHPKDDTLKKGPLRAMYNEQLATAGSIIYSYSLHATTVDHQAYEQFIEKISQFDKAHHHGVKNICGDAGYGTLETINQTLALGYTPYLKYDSYDIERGAHDASRVKYQAKYFKRDEHGRPICPAGHTMELIKSREVKRDNGKVEQRSFYRCTHCAHCKMKPHCIGQKAPNQQQREIQQNDQWQAVVKPQQRQRLDTPKAQAALKQRSLDVEPVFAWQKANYHYTRFRHFGREKCLMDLGLRCIASNIKKIIAIMLRLTKQGLCTFIFLLKTATQEPF